MEICNYFDFISESKLELLLEASLIYEPKFVQFLNDINSPISKKLLNLQHKEVGVDVNYIGVDLLKNDTITFIPDNKLKGDNYIVVDGYKEYTNLVTRAADCKLLDINNTSNNRVQNGNEGKIIKTLTSDDILSLFPSEDEDGKERLRNEIKSITLRGGDFIHFKFRRRLMDGKDYFYDTIILKSGLKLSYDVSGITKNTIKIGRFVKRILDKSNQSVTDKEIEDFVNKYKSLVNITNDALLRFKEVKGEDIRKYYYDDKYVDDHGTLGGSCMRYAKTQKFLNIYVENPEKISLIIFMSKDLDSDKISGRALLWSDNRDRKFMDRIYTNNDADEEIFKEYAKKHGYLYKSKQSFKYHELLLNGNAVSSPDDIVNVELKPEYYESYPYMDTIRYYNPTTGLISNDSTKCLFELRSTDGTYGKYA